MNIQVQGAAEALDEGDDAGPCAIGGLQARALCQVGLDGASDHGQATAQSLRAAREEHAQRPGEAQHPLANRYTRDNVIDQMS